MHHASRKLSTRRHSNMSYSQLKIQGIVQSRTCQDHCPNNLCQDTWEAQDLEKKEERIRTKKNRAEYSWHRGVGYATKEIQMQKSAQKIMELATRKMLTSKEIGLQRENRETSTPTGTNHKGNTRANRRRVAPMVSSPP